MMMPDTHAEKLQQSFGVILDGMRESVADQAAQRGRRPTASSMPGAEVATYIWDAQQRQDEQMIRIIDEAFERFERTVDRLNREFDICYGTFCWPGSHHPSCAVPVVE